MIWCLHGAVGMASDWKAFSREMAETGHEVRAVDLWRFLECRGLSLEEFGEALNREVEAVDSDPVVVGYSMGGRLALHALLARSSSWQAAVIVSAHPGLAEEKERVMRMAADAEWAAAALTGDWGTFLERWEDQPVLSGGGKGLEDRKQLVGRRESVARSFMEWSLGKQRDLREELRRIEVPVLWVTGEEDGKFTDLAAETVAHLSDGRHRPVRDAGHRAPWEQPACFSGLVREFLDDR